MESSEGVNLPTNFSSRLVFLKLFWDYTVRLPIRTSTWTNQRGSAWYPIAEISKFFKWKPNGFQISRVLRELGPITIRSHSVRLPLSTTIGIMDKFGSNWHMNWACFNTYSSSEIVPLMFLLSETRRHSENIHSSLKLAPPLLGAEKWLGLFKILTTTQTWTILLALHFLNPVSRKTQQILDVNRSGEALLNLSHQDRVNLKVWNRSTSLRITILVHLPSLTLILNPNSLANPNPNSLAKPNPNSLAKPNPNPKP
jgi:hypothetical protein